MGAGRIQLRVRAGSLLGAAALGCAALAGITVAAGSPAAGAVTRHLGQKVRPADAPIGPFTVSNDNREDVVQFFNQVYQASAGVTDPGWTGGSVAGCTPGSVSPSFLTATLSRINYYRTMAGMPDVTFNGTSAGTSADPNNAESQAAALMEAANFATLGLDHTPPQAGTNCWTQQAFNGSSHSNLDAGVIGPAGIDLNVYDNGPLGHRRNMLDPSISVMGAGALPATAGAPSVMAQLVLTAPLATRPPVRTGFVAWPPEGFVPYQVVPDAWSFSLPNADFSAATVSMTLNGAAIPAHIRCVDPNTANAPSCGQFGEPAISWNPNNIPDGSDFDWPKPAADEPYKVTIGNVLVNGTAQSFTYNVTVIDPSVASAADTLTAPQGPASAPVNTNPGYTVTPLADASGYQWSTAPVTPGDLFDGAENGLGNWTASTPGYSPISTAEPDTGAASFRLSSQGSLSPPTAPPQQLLTLNKTLLASAGSQLSFDSRFWDIDNENAAVEVSTDGGSTWAPVFQNTFTGIQPAYTHQTVSLSQFAGQQIQLRFSLTHTNGEWFGPCCGEPNGWYFDNVTLSNVQDVGTPTLSPVSASPSFTYDNPTQGTVAIEARPQFSNPSFGSAFGGWSPSLLVTTTGSTGLTSLASSANPSTSGQQVTYTATVSPTDGGGTVSFTDGGTAIAGCQSLTLTGGQATCAQTYSAGGTHPIVASYSGDTGFSGSSSPTLSQVVNAPVATSGSITSSAPGVNSGQPVTFTATVSPTDGGGTVGFFGDPTVAADCGAVPLTAAGQAICTVTLTGPLHETIQAAYSGDTGFLAGDLGATEIAVEGVTTTSVMSSPNPSAPGQQVTYTAKAVDGNGNDVSSDGAFFFTDNGASITACGSEAPTCQVTYSTGGPHSIQAMFSPFPSFFLQNSESPVLSQSVGTLTGTSASVVSSANPSLTGQAVTYTATVTGSDLGGTVSFTDGGFPVSGCQSLSLTTGGQATCQQTYTDTASHSVSAFYSGDAGFAASAAPPVSQAVSQPPPPVVPAVTVTNAGSGTAQVNFGQAAGPARAATSSNVTGYNVYKGTTPGHESHTPVNPSRILATASGFTVKGLTNGTKYYFTVKAINAAGLGPASKEVSAIAATTPGSPASLTATPGANTAGLTWTAPASDGGGSITGYNVYEGTAPGAESAAPVNASPLPGTARSFSVTGLTDGTAYYFTVRAINAAGVSKPSAEAAARPAAPPGKPVAVHAYAANGSAALTWAAPSQDGGSPVTGYNVYDGTVSHHESATPVNKQPLSATATGYTVAGLGNGTKYYFIVKAINAAATGAASAETSATPTTAATPPGPPRVLTGHPASGTVKLTWAAPASDGGKAVTGYDVYKGTVPGQESGTPVNKTPLPAAARNYTLTGLTNAEPYYFIVKAINSVGAGQPSKEAAATPEAAATAPAAPAAVKATAGTGSVTLHWAAPPWDGGSAVTGYNVYKGTVPGGESGTPVNASPLPPTATSYKIGGLAGGVKYYFTVKAINAAGPSAASSEVSGTPG